MPKDQINFLDTPDALEVVAAVEHERWSHWQRYLHEQCTSLRDGSLVIPSHLVGRWARQMTTSYSELSDDEKASDREQAREYIAALKRIAEPPSL
jgi:hypothetical protein